jgi:hypothetical protein
MVDVIVDNVPKIAGNLFAFLSLSKVANSLLMWSHYTNAHTGFVIAFDSSNDFFAPGTFSLHGLRRVK